jgi:hypothetical protein
MERIMYLLNHLVQFEVRVLGCAKLWSCWFVKVCSPSVFVAGDQN